MENNFEREIQKEIDYYNSLPVKFDNFIYPCDDIPLNDGVVFISSFNMIILAKQIGLNLTQLSDDEIDVLSKALQRSELYKRGKKKKKR
jgi:hypothetical protein